MVFRRCPKTGTFWKANVYALFPKFQTCFKCCHIIYRGTIGYCLYCGRLPCCRVDPIPFKTHSKLMHVSRTFGAWRRTPTMCISY